MLTDTTGGHDGSPGLLLERVLGTHLLLVDLPMSAVGDTLTLPLTWSLSGFGRKYRVIGDPKAIESRPHQD